MSEINTIEIQGPGKVVIQDDKVIVTGFDPKKDFNHGVLHINAGRSICFSSMDSNGNQYNFVGGNGFAGGSSSRGNQFNFVGGNGFAGNGNFSNSSFNFGNATNIINSFFNDDGFTTSFFSGNPTFNNSPIFVNGRRYDPSDSSPPVVETIEIPYTGAISAINNSKSSDTIIDSSNMSNGMVRISADKSSSCTITRKFNASNIVMKAHASSSIMIETDLAVEQMILDTKGSSTIKTSDDTLLGTIGQLILDVNGSSTVKIGSSFIKSIEGKLNGCSNTIIRSINQCPRCIVKSNGLSTFTLN